MAADANEGNRVTESSGGPLVELDDVRVWFPLTSGILLDRHVGDVKAVIVNEALREIEPMAWNFVANFARDNDLQMGEVCVLPEPLPAQE